MIATSDPEFTAASVGAALVAFRFVFTWSRRWWPRDRQRIFTPEQRRYIHRRAGYRCEHHWVGVLRCRKRARLEADHIMPWSRGGRTSLDNGQSLCRRHNRSKSNRIPSMAYRLRLVLAHRNTP